MSAFTGFCSEKKMIEEGVSEYDEVVAEHRAAADAQYARDCIIDGIDRKTGKPLPLEQHKQALESIGASDDDSNVYRERYASWQADQDELMRRYVGSGCPDCEKLNDVPPEKLHPAELILLAFHNAGYC